MDAPHTTSSPQADLTGRLLVANAAWSLLGHLLPLAGSLAALPLLVAGLGEDRFALLALVWVVFSRAGVLDLGVARAMTKRLAEGADDRAEHNRALVGTALVLQALLGLIGAVLLWAAAPLLVHHVLKVPPELRRQAVSCFMVTAGATPLVILTAGFRGILEARQRFGSVTIVTLTTGLLSMIGPLALLPFTTSVVAIVLLLAALQVAALAATVLLCRRACPGLRPALWGRWRVAHAAALLRLGGWMTVSNVVSTPMIFVDRFLIGAMISLAVVTYYATPFDAVTKLWLVPVALAGVLFPAFSTSFAVEPARSAALFRRAVKYVVVMLFPPALLAAALAREGLGVWLGPAFPERSTLVLQLLSAGVFLGGVGIVPLALLQGVGKPKWPALMHLAEFPVYLVLTVWAIGRFGLPGAAAVWAGRFLIETVVLFVLSGRALALARDATVRLITGVVACAALLAAAPWAGPLWGRFTFAGVVLAAFIVAVWNGVFDALDREMVRLAWRRILGRTG